MMRFALVRCRSIYPTTWSRYSVLSRAFSSEPAPKPLDFPPSSTESKAFSPKIQSLVDDISKLNLLEVADLNECLKKTLKIEAVPMAMAGGFAGQAPKAAEENEEQAPKKQKTAFTVKLLKFDEGKKVALIKEVKTLVEGMNLVQAKKFVESCPQVLKANVPKDEAEKIQKTLEALGAAVEVE